VAPYGRAVADRWFLVTRARGPAWDHSRPRREQAGWDEHAAFMDTLTGEGVVVLGGPVGEGDGADALLVLDVADEASAHACLADDPWAGTMLTTSRVEPWTVLLRRR
jgi:uncharacterized protein YciI